jgi:hypothetical protein
VVRALEVVVAAAAVWGMCAEAASFSRTAGILAAKQPIPRQYAALQTWVLAHTRPDDVVLSTNELSFAWSALTGRKALVTRRAQNDAFVDMDERNRDAALILYGRDDAQRRRLLARWNVGYVLWTTDWVPTEYRKDPNGGTLMIDPLLYFANPDYDAQLRRAGVELFSANTWVDPALQGPGYPTFDLTLISPTNYERWNHPWRNDLDPLLEQVWSFSEGGSPIWRRSALERNSPRDPRTSVAVPVSVTVFPMSGSRVVRTSAWPSRRGWCSSGNRK